MVADDQAQRIVGKTSARSNSILGAVTAMQASLGSPFPECHPNLAGRLRQMGVLLPQDFGKVKDLSGLARGPQIGSRIDEIIGSLGRVATV